MTLEDAILYHDRNARLHESAGWSQSAADDLQHVEWLTELRTLRNTHIGQLTEIHGLKDENAKLRDAMLSDAKKHALHHMDEDELRIWATQQAETIDGLRDLCKELYHRYWDVEGELFIDPDMDELTRRVRDFGIEAE